MSKCKQCGSESYGKKFCSRSCYQIAMTRYKNAYKDSVKDLYKRFFV